jgi:uncharacterized protein
MSGDNCKMVDKDASMFSSSDDDLELDPERLDRLLQRGLDDISDIEIDEITKGVTGEEIEQQFSSDGPVDIQRSEYSSTNKIGDIIIENSVQFIADNKRTEITDIPIDELDQLNEVQPGDLLAVCPMNEQNSRAREKLLVKYDDEFQDKAGVSVTTDGTNLSVYATRTGKVVVFHDRVHVVSGDADGMCHVHVASDLMSVTIDLAVHHGNGRKLTISRVLDELEMKNVVKGISRSLLEESVAKVNREKCGIKRIKVASGKAAINGADAKATFHYPTETPDIGFRIRPDGKIDYKKQAPIQMVQEGALLATVSEPGKGIAGYKVTGEIIPAKDGEESVIIEGQNVRVSDNNKSYYAACSGMISFHDNVLDVFPHYQVDGDVDMRSGNIDFNGSVTVLGTVQSGFEVRATGDIFVTGSVEAAVLDAGRDIRVNGAILGGTDSIARAGRNVFAGHMQNALIESQGDVVVVRSIMHSTVYCTGKVYLHDRNGSIIGGMVSALRGIETMSIGSHMGTQTEVVTGSDYLVQRKRAEIGEIIRFDEASIGKIDTVLRPLLEIVKKGIPLGPDKKRRLKTIIDKRKVLSRQLHLLRHKLNSLAMIEPTAASPSIIVKNILYSDVTVKIVSAVLKTTDDMKGVQCILDKQENRIELKPIHMVTF